MAVDMLTKTVTRDDSIEMHLVLVQGRYYLSGPLVEPYADGREYLEVSHNSDRPEIQELYGLFLQTLQQSTAAEYTTYLGATRSIVDVGDTVIDGEPARQYDATVDVELFLDRYAEAANASQIETLQSAGIEEFPVSFWFDESGRLVRAEQEVTVLGQTVRGTLSNGDFGEPVTIMPPDPDDVGH